MEKINTPMQELIEKIEVAINDIENRKLPIKAIDEPVLMALNAVLEAAKNRIEKEKQVIMDAFNQGYRDGELLEDSQKPLGDVSDHCDAEDYYNVTFNTTNPRF